MYSFTFHISNGPDVIVMANTEQDARQAILTAWLDGKPIASESDIRLWHTERK